LIRGAGSAKSLRLTRAAERTAVLMSDSLFLAASLLYFVPISVVVAATSLAAFGRDLMPRLRTQSSEKTATQTVSKRS
jgi:hypothetical protein